MLSTDSVLLGAGQCGCRIARYYQKRFEYTKENVLLFNTAYDDEDKELIVLHNEKSYDGSGRLPLVTLENIIPQNEKLIADKVLKIIRNRNTIILFNSLGGGSGSAINYHIIKNILIPYKKEYDINIISVIIMPFKHEGNPCNSNSSGMLNMYYELTKYISIIPVENDHVHKEGYESTYDMTNEWICDHVYEMLNYDYFVGTPKVGGLGTLDRKEFERILNPNNGFLVNIDIQMNRTDDLNNESSASYNQLNGISMETAKSMIILFRTKQGIPVNMNIVEIFNNMYPDIVKIFAESETDTDENYISVLANGTNIPKAYVQQTKNAIRSVNNYNNIKKKSIKKNKKATKIGSKRLLNLF